MMKQLIAKYDVPAPRYTSYPTVPYWETTPTTDQWLEHVDATLKQQDSSWSMYLHIPYCESLCTFCGCNNTITKDHSKGQPYVNALLAEWELYKKKQPLLTKKTLKQIHLGGGTPTFLSASELKTLLTKILSDVVIDKDHFEGSIEVDPRKTNIEQLEVLRELGFTRVSLGVQDFNPEVQRLVNRIQPFDITKNITDISRSLGFTSVNFDLIYGLAKQTEESIKETVEKTILLRPDRIALYSFALVPWIKPQQRLFKDEDLPKAEEKRNLYEVARKMLLTAGYIEVGMDHFALPTDGLAQKLIEKKLHRNFMGYTDVKTDLLLGLGVSSISETPYSFHQNEKIIQKYYDLIAAKNIPTFRGHIHSDEDRKQRQQILELMTQSEVALTDEKQLSDAKSYLEEMIKDELVVISEDKLKVTENGRAFLRNACVFFDLRLRQSKPQTRIFSQSI